MRVTDEFCRVIVEAAYDDTAARQPHTDAEVIAAAREYVIISLDNADQIEAIRNGNAYYYTVKVFNALVTGGFIHAPIRRLTREKARGIAMDAGANGGTYQIADALLAAIYGEAGGVDTGEPPVRSPVELKDASPSASVTMKPPLEYMVKRAKEAWNRFCGMKDIAGDKNAVESAFAIADRLLAEKREFEKGKVKP